MKKLKFIGRFAWVAIAIIITIFFVVSLTVYFKIEPENMTDRLYLDETWSDISKQIKTTNDLETNKYVTKVCGYGFNEKSLNVSCIINENDRIWGCATVEDENAEYNYYIECFVRSDFADKDYVKRFWSICWKSYIQDTNSLVFERTQYKFLVQSANAFGDLKKGDSLALNYYEIFLRLIHKPDYNDINYGNIDAY